MKNKETLEEFIQRQLSLGKYQDQESAIRCSIELGVKWQAEQDKNLYSEEDMMFAYEQGARLALLSQSPLARHKGEFPNPKEWFNQFKKK